MASSQQSQSSLVGPSWIFPEMVSFFVRDALLRWQFTGTLENVLLLLCGLIFLLNCFEFSTPPNEVMVLYGLSALLSTACVIAMVVEASVNEKYTPEKYYITVFEVCAATGSTIVMGYFYFFP